MGIFKRIDSMKVKDFVYFILDAVHSVSEDSIINEDHVIFLMKKYRSFLIKKEQEKEKSSTDVASEFEYQQICLDLEKVEAIDGLPCEGGYYLRTTKAIPKILEGTTPRVYPIDYYSSPEITYISRDRMRFVGTNPYLKNIIWISVGPDLHLYLKSNNPQFLYLQKLRMNAIFEDFDDAAGLLCDDSGESTACDVLDASFPIRDYLVASMIELIEKEVLGVNYRPSDSRNNSADDLADLMSFIRRNTKSSLQQQIEG